VREIKLNGKEGRGRSAIYIYQAKQMQRVQEVKSTFIVVREKMRGRGGERRERI